MTYEDVNKMLEDNNEALIKKYSDVYPMLCLMKELSTYSDEWKYLVEEYFVPKCEVCGFCTERYCCGRKPKKEVK